MLTRELVTDDTQTLRDVVVSDQLRVSVRVRALTRQQEAVR